MMDVLWYSVVVVVLGAYIYIVCTSPYVRAYFWYKTAAWAQAIAYEWGRLGIFAENAYRQAVTDGSLA